MAISKVSPTATAASVDDDGNDDDGNFSTMLSNNNNNNTASLGPFEVPNSVQHGFETYGTPAIGVLLAVAVVWMASAVSS